MKKLRSFAPYSFSIINLYKQCPRKFKYAKIDKIPVEDVDDEPLVKGIAIHSILEDYPNFKPEHNKYFHFVEDFINSDLGKKYLNSNGIAEQSFGLNKDFTETSFWDKSGWYRGKIDLICTIDNQLNLIDYKSGKYKEEKWQDYSQLMSYAVWLFLKYTELQTIRIAYVYVEHNQENELILNRKSLVPTLKDIITTSESIETCVIFEKKITKLCDWCPYQKHCKDDKN